MSNDFEVIVVGAGAMGAATAYQLAAKGHAVALIEQFQVGHERGASHGESRIIRLSYEDPVYVRLAEKAYEEWDKLEFHLGRKLVTITGGIDLGEADHPIVKDCAESLKNVGVPFEILDRPEISRRFPQFMLAPGTIGLYQADAGIINPSEAVKAMAALAQRLGATLLEEEQVMAILPLSTGVEVRTAKGAYAGRHLVIAAGPWSAPVLQSLGAKVPITVTQEQYAFFTPRQPALFQRGKFPVFIHYGPPGRGPAMATYGFPIYGLEAVKVAEHHAGPVTTAYSRTFEANAAGVRRLRRYVERTLPDANGDLIKVATCLYSNTPDRHFILDRLKGCDSITVGAGFSGHGFKFAPLIGRILADLATHGKTDQPIEMFSLSRFAKGRIL